MAMNFKFYLFFQVGFLRYLATHVFGRVDSGVSCKV
jgi:hypothetical protein